MQPEVYHTVSVTEIRLRSIRHIFRFIRLVKQIRLQLATAPGLKKYKVFAKGFTVFNSLSAWESDEAMYNFMRSGAHAHAMKQAKHIASATRYTRRRNVHFPHDAEARQWLDEDMPNPLYK